MPIILSKRIEKENNREYAYRVLRDNIMTLQLLPGTTINEGELAELFHTSRTPIHEAVLMLKEEYLVDVYPQSGSKISRIQLDILKEGYFLRSLIEPELIAHMAGNISSGQAAELRENLDRQKAALHQKDKIDTFLNWMILSTSAVPDGRKTRTWYAVKKSVPIMTGFGIWMPLCTIPN